MACCELLSALVSEDNRYPSSHIFFLENSVPATFVSRTLRRADSARAIYGLDLPNMQCTKKGKAHKADDYYFFYSVTFKVHCHMTNRLQTCTRVA